MARAAELLRPGNFSTGDPIYLSTTNQIHCITYHRQHGEVARVKVCPEMLEAAE